MCKSTHDNITVVPLIHIPTHAAVPPPHTPAHVHHVQRNKDVPERAHSCRRVGCVGCKIYGSSAARMARHLLENILRAIVYATQHDEIDTEYSGDAWAPSATAASSGCRCVLRAAGAAPDVELVQHKFDQAGARAEPPRNVREV